MLLRFFNNLLRNIKNANIHDTNNYNRFDVLAPELILKIFSYLEKKSSFYSSNTRMYQIYKIHPTPYAILIAAIHRELAIDNESDDYKAEFIKTYLLPYKASIEKGELSKNTYFLTQLRFDRKELDNRRAYRREYENNQNYYTSTRAICTLFNETGRLVVKEFLGLIGESEEQNNAERNQISIGEILRPL
jgi:type IV secretory pathway VirB4 component